MVVHGNDEPKELLGRFVALEGCTRVRRLRLPLAVLRTQRRVGFRTFQQR